MAKIKILLIDNSEMLRIYFRDVFWVHGLEEKYELTTVQSITQGEKIITDLETRPALVFLDLMLPSEEGGRLSVEASLMFIERMKTNPEFKNIKIVVFTAHSDPVFERKTKKIGVDGYLKKEEFMPKDIVDFVNNQFSS